VTISTCRRLSVALQVDMNALNAMLELQELTGAKGRSDA
jgi:hypothetical protein